MLIMLIFNIQWLQGHPISLQLTQKYFIYLRPLLFQMPQLLFSEEAKRIAKSQDAMKMKILPMHGSLPASEQVWPLHPTSYIDLVPNLCYVKLLVPATKPTLYPGFDFPRGP